MELTENERQKVAEVLFAYAVDWQKIAQGHPDAKVSVEKMGGYFSEEATLTLAYDNDVLGDR